MRVSNWEKQLKLTIQKHMTLPSKYGVSDCYIFPDDVVEAITGKTMYGLSVRKYKTDVGAAKQLRKKGFTTVEDAFSAKFAEIPVSLAQRGDIGTIFHNGDISGGVFTPQGFAVRDEKSIMFLPLEKVRKAFRVE